MSKKCPGCNKTVYFAERQVKDGVDWHGSCLIRHVQDQKKGAQASNPFQSYRGASSPSAPRREVPNSNSRPSSVDIASSSTPQPTSSGPIIYDLPNSTSPPPSRFDRSPERVFSNLSTSTEAPWEDSVIAPQSPDLREPERTVPQSPDLREPERTVPQSPDLREPERTVPQSPGLREQEKIPPQSPNLREPERKNSSGQLSKVEEFLLQQASHSTSTGPSSLSVSSEASSDVDSNQAAETKPAGEGTGFCSNCGEPRGTDGAKFCSNCGDELF